MIYFVSLPEITRHNFKIIFVIMSMEKKNYSKQEKLKILKEASEKGLKLTLEKYNLYPIYLLLLETEVFYIR